MNAPGHPLRRFVAGWSAALVGVLAGIASTAPLALAAPHSAEAAAPAAAPAATAEPPYILGAEVVPPEAAGPDATLHVTVWGTPDSQVQVRVGGAAAALPLSEVSPGTYQGLWPLARIAPQRTQGPARVIVELAHDGRSVSVLLEQDVAQAPVRRVTAAAPAIDTLQVHPVTTAPGEVLVELRGTPGGLALAWIVDGEARLLPLPEVSPGRYRARTAAPTRGEIYAELEVDGRVAMRATPPRVLTVASAAAR